MQNAWSWGSHSSLFLLSRLLLQPMTQHCSVMPAKKKKSKAKRKPAVGRGDAKHGESGDEVDEQQQKTLNSQMRRLKIADEQQAEADEEAALLEEAIQLAAVEKKEIEEKERQNCQHGYNASSRSEERQCEGYMKTLITSFNSAAYCGEDAVSCLELGFEAALVKYEKELTSTSEFFERMKLCFLSAGTKFILDGNYYDGRICAMAAKYIENAFIAHERKQITSSLERLDCAALTELFVADEHTLVHFFRKRIPCSCLDEKYKEVKSIPKMGYCCSSQCPLPDRKAVRSNMVYCARCRKANYILLKRMPSCRMAKT